jgi:hypothetical protein
MTISATPSHGASEPLLAGFDRVLAIMPRSSFRRFRTDC